MAIADYLTTTNLGIGSGVILVFALIWFLMRRKGGDRLSLERHELQEDEQLRKIDVEVRQDSKEQRNDAEQLWSLIHNLHERAYQLRLDLGDKKQDYDFILQGLDFLKTEKEGVKEDKQFMIQINDAINTFLTNFPTQDPIVIKLISNIRLLQMRLFAIIMREDQLLTMKQILLRREYEETRKEQEAA